MSKEGEKKEWDEQASERTAAEWGIKDLRSSPLLWTKKDGKDYGYGGRTLQEKNRHV